MRLDHNRSLSHLWVFLWLCLSVYLRRTIFPWHLKTAWLPCLIFPDSMPGPRAPILSSSPLVAGCDPRILHNHPMGYERNRFLLSREARRGPVSEWIWCLSHSVSLKHFRNSFSYSEKDAKSQLSHRKWKVWETMMPSSSHILLILLISTLFFKSITFTSGYERTTFKGSFS